MANIVITSTDKTICTILNDISAEFDNVLKSSIVKSSVSAVEIVQNTDIGDYVQYTMNNGKTIQLDWHYIDSVDGVAPTDANNLFEMILTILQ